MRTGAIVAAVAAVGVVAGGCGSGSAPRPATAPSTAAAAATPTTSSAPPRPALPSASPRPSTYPVGFRVVSVTNRAAGTPPRPPSRARSIRVLRTSVWYPAAGGAPRRGSFPLVVFAHGYNVTPATYAPLLRSIAAAGYVVAAPLFPISGAGLPGVPREDDLPDQPQDLRSVITAMTGLSAPGRWLSGSLDAHRVAVVGHSDGGETVAAMLLVRQDEDPRLRAAVVLAGQLPTWGRRAPVSVPVLVEQGTADAINPPGYSRALYQQLRRPKSYLSVLGGSHIDPVVGDDLRATTTRAVVIAFLDAILLRSATAAKSLRHNGNRPGVTTLAQAQ